MSGFAFLIPANCTVRHLFFLPLISFFFFFFYTCVVVALRRWLLYGKWIIVSFGREDDNFSSVCHEGMGLFSFSYRSDLWGKMGRASKQTQTYLLFFKVCLCLSCVQSVCARYLNNARAVCVSQERKKKRDVCVCVLLGGKEGGWLIGGAGRSTTSASGFGFHFFFVCVCWGGSILMAFRVCLASPPPFLTSRCRLFFSFFFMLPVSLFPSCFIYKQCHVVYRFKRKIEKAFTNCFSFFVS